MKWFSLLLGFMLLAGCVTTSGNNNNGIERLAKSDIDEVIELHQQVVLRDLKKLMFKLYKRNPGLRYDRELRDIKASVELTFSRPFNYNYAEFSHIRRPTDIVRLALDEQYQGDRILAFIVGLRRMLMASYDNNTEFFYLTTIDQQKLYNSARNIEIAAWLLAKSRDRQGQLLILSDSLNDEKRNLSYQRLIGRMIATQDNLAEIISRKTGRIIKTFVVRAATVVFLPI
ncbi:hypothetical protein [Methylophaga sp.]|jgi:hypothetical protein|uniref:hypothetical protein n=1 Tax=Methylophaga sp. TaxID=2024840 RepID=UPI0013FE9A48|nr:hypothetical protein [Methylophaga sp.]MTI63128.1 hypothetical protein [Methylophaga sp.]